MPFSSITPCPFSEPLTGGVASFVPGSSLGCEGFANCGVLSGSVACARSCGLPVRLSGNLLRVPRRDRLLSRRALWVFVVGPYERPPKMERPELLDDSSELESSLGRTRP